MPPPDPTVASDDLTMIWFIALVMSAQFVGRAFLGLLDGRLDIFVLWTSGFAVVLGVVGLVDKIKRDGGA